MALIKVKFNEDIGSLVNTKDNTVFNGISLQHPEFFTNINIIWVS